MGPGQPIRARKGGSSDRAECVVGQLRLPHCADDLRCPCVGKHGPNLRLRAIAPLQPLAYLEQTPLKAVAVSLLKVGRAHRHSLSVAELPKARGPSMVRAQARAGRKC